MAIEVLKCLNPKCKKFSKVRGLCHPHYLALRKKIQDGKLSWAKAEMMGLCKPAQRRGWCDGWHAKVKDDYAFPPGSY